MATQGLPQVSKKERVENVIIAGVAILIALGMAIYSWIVLPDHVSTQPSFMSTGAPLLPKFFAVAFPFGLTTLMAASGVNHRRQFLLCLLGYAVYILLWLMN